MKLAWDMKLATLVMAGWDLNVYCNLKTSTDQICMWPHALMAPIYFEKKAIVTVIFY